MVNQSKAKDPRFWKKWRASGAVGTIEDAWKRNTHFETYMRKVRFVEDGIMGYESETRQLAEQHGLPLQALEAVLPVGRQKEYARKVRFVEDGIMSYESEARQLAEQHGLPLQALEAALPVGRQKEAQRKIAVYGTK